MTPKEKAFCENYVSNGFFKARAAKDAGYRGSYWAVASDNLRKARCQAYIKELLAEAGMSREEVVARLSIIAQGVPVSDFYTERAMTTVSDGPKGVTATTRVVLWPDLNKIKEAGLDHLVKEISPDGRIVWHDQARALEAMSKILGLQEPDGERREVHIHLDSRTREWEQKGKG